MTVVETTGFEIAPLSEDEARYITNKIRQNVALTWVYVEKAYKGRVWIALGYESWDSYCDAEFDGARIRLPREERQGVVASLRDAGMSIRAIASATGAAFNTVLKDVTQIESRVDAADELPAEAQALDMHSEDRGVGGDGVGAPVRAVPSAAPLPAVDVESDDTPPTPEPAAPTIVGRDGKNYPSAKPPAAPKRKPLNEQADRAGWDIRKVAERLERIAADDRFKANKQQVAAHLRSHLSYTVEVCQDLLDQLNEGEETR